MMSPQQDHPSAAHTLTLRQMSAAEREAASRTLRPIRLNAIGMSILAIATSIMVQFAYDPIVILVPLMIAAMCIGFSVQYRKALKAVQGALTAGTVPELRAVPVKKSAGRGWAFGPATFPRSGQLTEMLTEGVQSAVAFLPATKTVISVNGVPLKKPFQMIAPIGFGEGLTAQSQAMAFAPAAGAQPIRTQADELPPPPDGWSEQQCLRCGKSLNEEYSTCPYCGEMRRCPKCGSEWTANAMFCGNCGFRKT